MGIMQSFDISMSGVDAQTEQLEIIASNLANINSTRTIYGGPYRRKIPVFAEEPLAFGEALRRAEARSECPEKQAGGQDGTVETKAAHGSPRSVEVACVSQSVPRYAPTRHRLQGL